MTLALPDPELTPAGARRCDAHNRRGERCGAPAITGRDKCRLHCGLPLAEAKRRGEEYIRETLRDLRAPAIRQLRTILNDNDTPTTTRLAACKVIIDATPDESEDLNWAQREALGHIMVTWRDAHRQALLAHGLDEATADAVLADVRAHVEARWGNTPTTPASP